jgi:hydroxymethylpyrimidine kinase/phosphomethylpyrimidine kinase
MQRKPAVVLSIAGSDSGSGAGVEADLKSIHANGAYAVVVLTSVTAQNTRGVTAAFDLPAGIVRAQLDAVCGDFEIGAVKTGMLSNVEIAGLVAGELERRGLTQLVVDPVMISKSGFSLLKPDAAQVLRQRILPLARVCTPNRHEAEALSGMTLLTAADAERAAARIRALGPRAVLIKGGHLDGPEAVDLLLDGDELHRFAGPRIETRSTHGTGCTFSAAIAAWLARGHALPQAVALAKDFITRAIRGGLEIGAGHPPTDPFFFLRGRDWTAFTGGDDAPSR